MYILYAIEVHSRDLINNDLVLNLGHHSIMLFEGGGSVCVREGWRVDRKPMKILTRVQVGKFLMFLKVAHATTRSVYAIVK